MTLTPQDPERGGVSRRMFLAVSALVLLPLAGGVGMVLRFTRADSGLAAKLERLRAALLERRYRNTPLAEAIRRHYDYLDLAPGAVEQFVAAYKEHTTRLNEPASVVDGVERFLLSTDFFPQGADEKKQVHYTLFFAPLVSPCYKPFPPGPG